MIPTLEPAQDNTTVERSSTALEGNHYLSVIERGVAIPIAWREPTRYSCQNGVDTDTFVLDIGGALAQDYDVMECTYTEDEYILPEFRGVELNVLPESQGGNGDLFYEEQVEEVDFINSANGSLGQRNVQTLRKGLDYVRGKNVLTGDKAIGIMK